MSDEAQSVADRPKRSRLVRIRAAFAARDWVGIAIELAVVALGVLLAFRIEQWGQQRNRSIEERQFLERLYRENAQSVDELQRIHALHRLTVGQLGSAIRAKDDSAVLARLSRQEGYGCWGMQMPSATYNTTAAQELVASGGLNLVSDPDLRLQLRELASAQIESASQLDLTREITQLFAPYLHPFHRLSLGARPEPLCFMDWTDMMRDRNAYNAVVRTYRAHARMEQSRRSLLGKVEDAQQALSCALEKPVCRR